MRINHNISAINTYRNQLQNTKTVEKSLNKLSSGIRINQAADDSAGLAISEKMRGQIRGLEQADRNIEHGISLIQVAEARLGEIANPNLLRLRELAIQAANDTLTDVDRNLIQQEFDQVIKGIDHIANSTEFNTRKLLNGTDTIQEGVITGGGRPAYNFENVLNENAVGANGSFMFRTNEGYPTTGADNDQILVYGNGSTSFPSVRINGTSFRLVDSSTITSTTSLDGYQTTSYSINGQDVKVTQFVKIVKDKYEIKYSIENTGESNRNIGFQFHLDTMLGGDDHAPFIVNNSLVSQQTVYSNGNIPNEFTVYNQSTGGASNAEFQAGGIIRGEGIIEEPDKFAIGQYSSVSDWDFNQTNGSVGDSGYSLWWNPRDLAKGESFTVNTFYGQSIPPTIDNPMETFGKPGEVIIQVGPNEGQQFKIQLSDARARTLGIADLDVLSRENADLAIQKVDQAMQLVTSERTKYGAYQNALEHIGTNVKNYKENLTSSESRIRDLDVAQEITKLTNNQTILQSAQAMMAQANQITQGILQLLK